MSTVNFSTNIKNIIFDLGGVILNIDYRLTSKAFRELGFSNFDKLYSQARQSGLFDNFETGIINESQFVTEINALAGTQIAHHKIINAWNAMLLDFPKKRLSLLEELRGKYRLYLLSNTNETHQQAFEKILFDTIGIKNLDPWFEKIYYSHQIKLRKPDKEVFEYVLQQSNIEAQETLFIDDSAQHISGAKSVGIQALLLKNLPVEDIIKLLL